METVKSVSGYKISQAGDVFAGPINGFPPLQVSHSPIKSKVALRLLLCQPMVGRQAVRDYALDLTSLLGASLETLPVGAEQKRNLPKIANAVDDCYDLVLYEEPHRRKLRHWLLGPPICQTALHLHTSLLVVRQPRYPLRKILFVTRGQSVDNNALAWLILLAQASQAAVTILAIQPRLSVMCIEAMYGQGLADWLRSETPLGYQLRQITQSGISCDLRFRPGEPCRQVRGQIKVSQPDLIVLAADPPDWWSRRSLGAVVVPLLRWADRPVLIAR